MLLDGTKLIVRMAMPHQASHIGICCAVVRSRASLASASGDHCCVLQAFQHFDSDHSGFISPEEVEQALKKLGGASSADAAEMVKQYDINNDGQIDYNEFVQMLRKQDSSLQQASSFLRAGLRVPDGVQLRAV